MHLQNLRSPYVKTGGIVYFARMLDKIRMHTAGTLPTDYVPNLGAGFDLKCVQFLHVPYDALVRRTLQGGNDEEALSWCFENGRRPSPDEIEIWNEFMRKRGWNDDGSARLKERLAEGGFADRSDVQTFFDYIDLDEGRR